VHVTGKTLKWQLGTLSLWPSVRRGRGEGPFLAATCEQAKKYLAVGHVYLVAGPSRVVGATLGQLRSKYYIML
jgi:hypothetical protein